MACMSVAQKELLVSCHELHEIVKSLEKEAALGKKFDEAHASLRKSNDWTEQTTDPRNGKVLPSAYFLWNANKDYLLVVPPNFNKPSHLEVRTTFSYPIDKSSKGLPNIQLLSIPQITERFYMGRGMGDKQVSNPNRCIFDPLVNLDVLFGVVKNSGANLDQIVERFSDKKIGFNPTTTGINFAELESPVCFNHKGKYKGYLIMSLKAGKDMKVSIVYRPQV
jgi:hypothetical protein